jgi:hypothetical protein
VVRSADMHTLPNRRKHATQLSTLRCVRHIVVQRHLQAQNVVDVKLNHALPHGKTVVCCNHIHEVHARSKGGPCGVPTVTRYRHVHVQVRRVFVYVCRSVLRVNVIQLSVLLLLAPPISSPSRDADDEAEATVLIALATWERSCRVCLDEGVPLRIVRCDTRNRTHNAKPNA